MKKGISPLIATVLLVGLTVTLIATIATWVIDLQKKSETFASEQQRALELHDFNFEVIKVSAKGTDNPESEKNIELSIINNEESLIDKFLIVEYKKGERDKTTEVPAFIASYATNTISIKISPSTTEVKLIPVVENIPITTAGKTIKVP